MTKPVVCFASLAALLGGCAIDASPEGPTEREQSALDLAPPPAVPGIPITGTVNAAYKPVDDAILRFMRERCVGGAVIGVSYDGNIYNRGYGYKDGPPSAACATAHDPFVGGDQIQPSTPFRIGSNGKAVLAAVVRIELKKALSAHRGAPVTDADIEALKLIDNGELELVSPEARSAMLGGGNLGGFVVNACPIVDAWSKVTIGQLLSHHAGLQRGSDDVYEELSKIRSLSSAAVLSAQESASGAPAAAKAALKAAQGNSAYFVPPYTLEEYARAQGDQCFAYEPGTVNSYSNSGFGMLGYVLEHVTGRAFTAKNGYPFMHSWSLLSDFTEAELGFDFGIELSQLALGKRDPAEPRYRHWSGSSYYPTEQDDKRPWCLLSGGHCEFDAWAGGTTRYNWNWTTDEVPFTFGGHSVSGGVGYLAAEAPKYLAFMHRYSVSTPYGEDRALFAQTQDKSHSGSIDGTSSWVAELNDGSLGYTHFGSRADGTMSFDPAKSSTGSCTVPAGIDVFFAMNQRSDAKCTAQNECVTDTTSAYSDYVSVLKEALCAVQWNAVSGGH